MTQFSNRVLAALERIYRFTGGQRGTSDVDLKSPVQRVHDVAGIAAYEAGILINVFDVLVIAGASGSGEAIIDIDDIANLATPVLAQRGVDFSEVECWLITAGVQISAATIGHFATGNMFVTLGTLGGQATQSHLLCVFDSAAPPVFTTGGDGFPNMDDVGFSGEGFRPMRLFGRAGERGATTKPSVRGRFTSGIGGGLTVTLLAHLWVGPTYPPFL